VPQALVPFLFLSRLESVLTFVLLPL